jgi:hypothetical protein
LAGWGRLSEPAWVSAKFARFTFNSLILAVARPSEIFPLEFTPGPHAEPATSELNSGHR